MILIHFVLTRTFFVNRLITLCFMVLGFTCTSAATAAIETDTLGEDLFSPDEIKTKLAAFQELQDVASNVPLTLEQVLEQNDYELGAVISHVKEHIQYEPYEGLLRGVSGVLESQAGNSLDQAFLLATLIKDLGYDARIAVGTLDARYREKLLNEDNRAPPIRPAVENSEVKQAIQSIEPGKEIKFLAPDESIVPAWIKAIHDTTAGLQDIADVGRSHFENQRPSESNYYCVQIKDNSFSAWKTIHPAYVGEDENIHFVATSYIANTIPGELQHQVTFQVLLERISLGKPSVIEITPKFSYPTALEHNLSWSYRSVPNGFLILDEWNDESVKEALRDSTKFLPQVNEFPVANGKIFDALGNAVPIADAMSNYAGIFETLSGQMNDATSALHGLAADSHHSQTKAQYTSKVWLQIEIHSPGSRTQLLERTLAEWTGNKDEFYRELARDVTVTIETGQPSFVKFLRTLSRAQSQVLAAVFNDEVTSNPEDLSNDVKFLASVDGRLFFLFSDLLSEQLISLHRFRYRPSLVAHYRSLLAYDPSNQGFDILTNAKQGIAPPQDAFEASLEAGVIDAFVEKVIVSRTGYIERASFDELADDRSNYATSYWDIDLEYGEIVGRLPNGWGGVTGGPIYSLSCISFMVAAPEYVKQLVADSLKIWGARQHGNILWCGNLAAGIALSIQTAPMIAPGMGEICDTVPEPTVSLLCHATVNALRAISLVSKQPVAQNKAREVITRFFFRCIKFLRTGTL